MLSTDFLCPCNAGCMLDPLTVLMLVAATRGPIYPVAVQNHLHTSPPKPPAAGKALLGGAYRVAN